MPMVDPRGEHPLFPRGGGQRLGRRIQCSAPRKTQPSQARHTGSWSARGNAITCGHICRDDVMDRRGKRIGLRDQRHDWLPDLRARRLGSRIRCIGPGPQARVDWHTSTRWPRATITRRSRGRGGSSPSPTSASTLVATSRRRRGWCRRAILTVPADPHRDVDRIGEGMACLIAHNPSNGRFRNDQVDHWREVARI